MRAIQVLVPGGPQALTLVDLPEPQPGPGQVRVRARAIGVGRPDVLIRNGTYKWMPPLPAIPGAEMAGEVDAVGEGVTQWARGDRVLVSARDLPVRGGCYAEAIVVPERAPYRLPATIDLVDAVSLPNLARHHGLQVIGTARTEDKRAYAKAHGFEAVLDPAAPDLPAQVKALTQGRGVDLAFDPIGAGLFIDCLHALAPLGTAVSYNIVAGPPSEDVFRVLRSLLGRSLAVRCFSMHTFDEETSARRALMQSAIDLMAQGHVRAPGPTRMRLDQARQAHAVLDAGQTQGKMVLEP